MPLGLLSLKVARPYFWLVTLWLYLLPTGRQFSLLASPIFWLGLAYCTYPLNLLCYWMNDFSDVKVDEHNPRKGGSLLGTKAGAAPLRALFGLMAAVQLPFLLAFCLIWGPQAVVWFACVVLVNWAYNFGPRLSSNYAPLDLFSPCGYILVIPLSVALNRLPAPPMRAYAHAVFLVVRTQLWLQVVGRLAIHFFHCSPLPQPSATVSATPSAYCQRPTATRSHQNNPKSHCSARSTWCAASSSMEVFQQLTPSPPPPPLLMWASPLGPLHACLLTTDL